MALSFTRKTYTDAASSGSGVSASDLNRIEQQISDLTNAVNTINKKLYVRSSISEVTFNKTDDRYEIWMNDGSGAQCIVFNKTFIGVYDSVTGSSKSWK